ncbi:MAG TPA: ATP cone domain-containing protein [Gemmataceae bacterium]|nr:ATP cone domain-containing protein [Gemmataceae bacterium]
MIEESAAQPAWIYKRDGRLVPFDSDKISQALFAATESLGRPDPFMARELTDGVLHFLASEVDRTPFSTTQVAELVAKVVRELGQPGLAQAFVDFARHRLPRDQRTERASRQAHRPAPSLPPKGLDPQSLAWQTSGSCWREFALREIFGRDLAAAHQQGLLVLGGLEAPLEPTGGVLSPTANGRLMETILRARQLAGGMVAVDSPEYELAGRPPEDASEYARQLSLGLHAAGLRAVLNLNTDSPPVWAADLAEGPLFPARGPCREREELARLAVALWENIRTGDNHGRIRLDWHLSERDFSGSSTPLLTALVRQAVEGAPIAFTFDRSRRPIALAEGLDRSHPVVLMVVGVQLTQLAEQLGGQVSSGRFLEKIPSLARLALSAGVQKRDFLRRYRSDWPTFLLGQARLVVVPIGLNAVVERLVGGGLATGGPPAELARTIVQSLAESLQRAGAAYRLDTAVDSALDGQLETATDDPPLRQPSQVGLTCANGTLAARTQIKAAAILHAATNAGTAHVLFADDALPGTEELLRLLKYACQQTSMVRLRFQRHGSDARQMVAPWEEMATR